MGMIYEDTLFVHVLSEGGRSLYKKPVIYFKTS